MGEETMETYIALLRGINVGGKNTIKMASLREMMEAYGFKEVKTYINSGNLIFSSAITDSKKLKEICEQLITEKFKLTISVTIISAEELLDGIDHVPVWWDVDKESKHNALFVIPPATTAEIMKEVSATKEEFEKIASFGQLIFWSAPSATYSTARLSKIVRKPYYDKITIRNANTVRKLVELVRK